MEIIFVRFKDIKIHFHALMKDGHVVLKLTPDRLVDIPLDDFLDMAPTFPEELSSECRNGMRTQLFNSIRPITDTDEQINDNYYSYLNMLKLKIQEYKATLSLVRKVESGINLLDAIAEVLKEDYNSKISSAFAYELDHTGRKLIADRTYIMAAEMSKQQKDDHYERWIEIKMDRNKENGIVTFDDCCEYEFNKLKAFKDGVTDVLKRTLRAWDYMIPRDDANAYLELYLGFMDYADAFDELRELIKTD